MEKKKKRILASCIIFQYVIENILLVSFVKIYDTPAKIKEGMISYFHPES